MAKMPQAPSALEIAVGLSNLTLRVFGTHKAHNRHGRRVGPFKDAHEASEGPNSGTYFVLADRQDFGEGDKPDAGRQLQLHRARVYAGRRACQTTPAPGAAEPVCSHGG
jgi:hypothetical protein